MAGDPLLARARAAWLDLTGVPMAFPAGGGVEVAASAGSRLCPPGWVGIVVLGGAAVVTVPSDGLVGTVRAALRRLPVAELTDAGRLRALLPVAGVLGPASLAYLDEPRFRPASGDVSVVPGAPADVAALLAAVPADDADECGLADVTSPVFVVRRGADVLAAAGYRRWPGRVAHLGVLTRADRRGRGLARAVASAAVVDALTNGLLPQWRARPEPSRRVARALGFRQLGAQLSLALRQE
ncbi:GNAT family N-acetyltransferase [Micromonospora sp. NPDC051300]|uniref:GNAT family N-acetyltransferase n=1 Tax=Micromonospora sp. NPDC051300 TaxID=3364286 RepID=UPI00378A3A29